MAEFSLSVRNRDTNTSDWYAVFPLLLACFELFRLSTISDRALPVAAARVWNSLLEHVTSAPSVAVLQSRLKTHLFDISYPDPV